MAFTLHDLELQVKSLILEVEGIDRTFSDITDIMKSNNIYIITMMRILAQNGLVDKNTFNKTLMRTTHQYDQVSTEIMEKLIYDDED